MDMFTRFQSAPADLTVSGSGFTLQTLQTGATAFGNRAYVWRTVPAMFAGWQFTQVEGGVSATITVHANREIDLFVISETAPMGADWQPAEGLKIGYTDKQKTILSVFKTHLKAGSDLPILQKGWAGVIVLLPPGAGTVAKTTTTTEAETEEKQFPPGIVIDSFPANSHHFVGSPAIVILPDGTFVAAHDIFYGAGKEGNHTRVFRSADRGKSWQMVADLDGQYWSNLFVHRGALYLFGTSGGFGYLAIRRSLDSGRSWTTPQDARSGVLSQEKGMHCAPTPVIDANGRLWRAFEFNPPGPKRREPFQAFVMSAPVDADLLNAASWTHTNALPYNSAETGGNWLEGNAVLAPNSEIVNILRISTDGLEKAALLHVSPDGRTISWNPSRDRIDLPGGGVKFTIRFDRTSGRYWSLVNKQRNPDALRNILSLISSPDLRRWQVESTLLRHPDRKKHAFQYIDWQFEGDDIIAVSRTSWNGDTFHNANFLTFHRIRHFRDNGRTLE